MLTPHPYYKTEYIEGSDATCFIQWKGTDVCMDFACACGKSVHIDADFVYNIKCPFCEQIYRVGTQVKLTKITEEELGDAVLCEPEPDYDEIEYWVNKK